MNFYVGPHIYMGTGSVEETLAGVRKAMIVTDKFMNESGTVKYVTGPLEARGIEYIIFDEVKPDPDLATIAEGMSRMIAFQPDAMYALGGGSPIDACKAMIFLATRDGLFHGCKFIAIPTTSGTGSEVTKFAVVSDPSQEAKYPLISEEMLPDAAILDAELVKTVPPRITADTGIDVFTHAVEALVSKNANDFTDGMAEKAIKLVRSYLLKVYKDPGFMEGRQRMHNASCMAGMAFSNAGLGINHSMAHTLGAHFHIPHGRANGILLPYVIHYNAGCLDGLTPAAKRYARIARALRIDGPSLRQSTFSMVRVTKQYIKKLDMPDCIKDAGVSQEEFMDQLDEMAERALNDACTATNPRECTKEDLKNIFLAAYHGNIHG